MGNTVAKITSKIVELTGNDATKAFIGKIVTRKSTKNGVVYVIGSTGYTLTTSEYKMFAEAGAIAQASIIPNKKKAASTVEASKPEVSETAPLASAAKAKKEVSSIEPEDQGIELGSEEHQALLETSDFLMNYPSSDFSLNTPRRLGFFDKKDDLKDKAASFFDKLGKKGRDKLVDAMSN